MLNRLYRWLRGYLLIRLKGQSPERFINLCSNRYLYLWNLQNIEGSFECNIQLKDYKKLKSIAKKTRTLPYIEKKSGLPFLIHHYKKRTGYLAGFIIFCTLLYILSLFIWDISFEGGHFYTSESMIKFLKENHIQAGMQKKEIDCQEIEELIRGTYKDIGWVSAEIKGTRLIIKITETNMPVPAVTSTKPCHIIASKDCIVDKIVTRTGTPMVQKGSVVKKGDILVSGIIDIVGDFDSIINKEPVIADADIIGKTYYDYKDSFSMNYLQRIYSGKTKKGYNFYFLLRKINIYNPSNPYKKYDIIVNDFKLHLNGSFYLPMGYSITNILEYTEKQQTYTKAEATAVAKERLKQYLDDLIKKDVLITKNNVKIQMNKNTCTAEGRIEVLESVKDFKYIDEDEWRIIDTDEPNGNDN